ncbi:hypothetical protein [Scale drop disease virus]|uniref:Uncharacterized protein n=1 Tax=Scale drop disease virus TaxID=1697349 RepID=A0A7D5YFY9_9VIRU|nr:hypothetical protein [Scale drop disease virus]QXJ13607.1 hypothetical protein PMJGCIOK_00040 [Scale drop disease virus]
MEVLASVIKMGDRKHLILYYSRHSTVCSELFDKISNQKGLIELLGMTVLSIDSPEARQWLIDHRPGIITGVPCLEIDYFNRDMQFIIGFDKIVTYLGL